MGPGCAQPGRATLINISGFLERGGDPVPGLFADSRAAAHRERYSCSRDTELSGNMAKRRLGHSVRSISKEGLFEPIRNIGQEIELGSETGNNRPEHGRRRLPLNTAARLASIRWTGVYRFSIHRFGDRSDQTGILQPVGKFIPRRLIDSISISFELYCRRYLDSSRYNRMPCPFSGQLEGSGAEVCVLNKIADRRLPVGRPAGQADLSAGTPVHRAAGGRRLDRRRLCTGPPARPRPGRWTG